jgi:hypothetical protein
MIASLKSSTASAGEGDHEVVEGARQAHAPSVSFADSSPVSRWSIDR